jgi:alkylation response protein AidB-like acyl-CoA dehydrogenase
MDISTAARGDDILQAVRAIGPQIDAASPQVDVLNNLPPELFTALIELDLFRLLQPRDYGGAELAPTEFVQIIEEVGKHDASTGWCLGQNNICSTVAAYLEPEAVQEIFRSPKDIVAWGPGPGEGRAVPGGYRLSGKFSFASGSRNATWLGAHVPVIEPDGTRRIAPDGSAITYTLLFPKSRAQVQDTWQVIGLKGTGSDSYTVADLFVPEEFSLARSTVVKPRVAGRLYAFTPSTLYSSSFAALALGIARATHDAFIRDVKNSIPRGAKKPRGENNVVQAKIGTAEAQLRSARVFLLGSLEKTWAEVQQTGALTAEQSVNIRLATTWAIQNAREVVASLYVAAGAMAIFEANPFEKRFRDIHTLGQQIQGHAAHFETVGQILLGMEPDRPMFTF